MAQDHYSDRAAQYDEANGGWHIQFGRDFVDWLSPITPDCAALDLACGTGLVTIPLASAVGPAGKVIGVDINRAMLDRARSKPLQNEDAEIAWLEHDIMALEDLSEIQTVVRERGGFDIISCCSALVLLPSPIKAIASWKKLLKSGGRMILDVPTEDKTLQYLLTVQMPGVLGLQNEFDRTWIDGVHSLERLFQDAGLKVERAWRTRSYVEERTYEGAKGEMLWEEQSEKYKVFLKIHDGRRDEARKEFLKLWRKNLDDNGRFKDGHWLYVIVGRKE